jgi:hypothetical protein
MTETLSGEHLRHAYEVLRAHALGKPLVATVPRGLALFLRSGLPGWMQAWKRLVPSPSRPVPTTASLPPPTSLGMAAELALLLTQMALSGRAAEPTAGASVCSR